MYIWNDQNLKSRELEIKIRDEIGAEQQLLSKKEIHDLEPNIKKIYHAGVFYKKARHARNPKKILLKFFDLFLRKGVVFKKTDVKILVNIWFIIICGNKSLINYNPLTSWARFYPFFELIIEVVLKPFVKGTIFTLPPADITSSDPTISFLL